MVKRYVLKGPYAGKTIRLGGFPFVAGVLEADYPTPAEHELLARHVRQWGAYLEEEDSSDGQRDVSIDSAGGTESDGRPEGEEPAPGVGASADDGGGANTASSGHAVGRLATNGSGPEEELGVLIPRLRKAVASLDPKIDADWTLAGKPALPAVERALGYGGITRAQVEAAMPGFTRATARGKR